MVTGVIPTIQPPQSGVSAERARERLDFLVPYDVPGGYSYTPPQPEMNTLGLLADPNIGPQSIVSVPLGRAGVVGERTGVINPAIQEETAAQQYMRQAQEMRQARIDEKDPARVTNKALRDGNNAGESKLLERMARSGLLSTLQGMARAERMYGVGPLAAFSESALDVQAARSAAQQKAAEGQLELDKERIKKSGPAKLTATIDKRLTSFRNNSEALNTINRYLTILTSGQTGGIAGKMDAGIDALASLVGLGSGSQASKAEAARSLLLSTISSLKQTEGQISKYDYEEIENYLKKPNSWYINNDKIANQLRNLRPIIQRTLSQDAMLIRESGRDPSQFSGYNNIRLSTPGRIINQ
jgi:hypothetical protein